MRYPVAPRGHSGSCSHDHTTRLGLVVNWTTATAAVTRRRDIEQDERQRWDIRQRARSADSHGKSRDRRSGATVILLHICRILKYRRHECWNRLNTSKCAQEARARRRRARLRCRSARRRWERLAPAEPRRICRIDRRYQHKCWSRVPGGPVLRPHGRVTMMRFAFAGVAPSDPGPTHPL